MSTTKKSTASRGFGSMHPEKRRAAAKKGGRSQKRNAEEASSTPAARGFAAMDAEKRKQIARRGGSTSRRNRIDWKEQAVVL